MQKLNVLITMLVLTISLAACSPEIEVVEYPYDGSAESSAVLASIDSDLIYRSELDHLLAFHSTNPNSSSEEGRMAILQSLIDDQVMYKKAIENNFDKNPEFIINQRTLLAYEYKKYLAEKVAKNTKVTELDIELYYQENNSQFTKPAMFRVAVYLRRNDIEKEHELTLMQISKAAEYLPADSGFGKYAQSSDHLSSQYRGGKLSWMTKNTKISGLPKAIFENINELKVGKVSSAISVNNGQYLIRLINQRAKLITPLADVKNEIRNKLINQSKQKTLAAYLKKARASYEIDIKTDQMVTSKAKLSSEHSFGPPGFPAK
jgi:parvulin-like peptidyl-prolyl isomerase